MKVGIVGEIVIDQIFNGEAAVGDGKVLLHRGEFFSLRVDKMCGQAEVERIVHKGKIVGFFRVKEFFS